MANKFDIIISATDRATDAIRRVNQNINRITQPIREVRRAATDLGRELGLGKVSTAFGEVRRSVGQVGEGIRRIVAPLAAVVGVGSISGVAALATEWGHMGLEISNTSRNLGVAVTDLQSLRGAANMLGVSSEALNGGLMTLGDTLNDAKWGRNQGALAMMRRLGVGIHMTADGSIDAVRGLKDMAGAISKIKSVETQRLVARQFGLEALLPLLRKGSAAISEYQEKAATLGGVHSQESINQAAAFGVQLNYLSIATKGLRTSIGDKLVPVLMPFVQRLTDWTAANRELIATKIAGFVQQFATWLSRVDFGKVLQGSADFIKKIDGVVEGFGGWKNVLIGIVGLKILGAVSPLISLAVALAQVGVSLGLVAAGSAGLAILAGATGFYAGYKGAEYLFGDKPDTGAKQPSGFGIHLRTKADLRAEASRQRVEVGLSPLAPGAMLSKDELRKEARQQWMATFGMPRDSRPLGIRSNNPLNLMPGGKEAVFPSMEAGINAAMSNLMTKRYFGGGNNTAAGIINTWSPPNAPGNSPEKNANYIAGVTKEVGAGPLDSNNPAVMSKLLSAMIRQENGAGSYDKSKMDQAVAHVVVEFKNQPAGTSATAKSAGGGDVPVRIAMSMPTLVSP